MKVLDITLGVSLLLIFDIHIKDSENLEAILGDSLLSRSADSFYEIGDQRVIGTSVRINNMCIEFLEHGRNDKTIGQATSEAIVKLCRVLAK